MSWLYYLTEANLYVAVFYVFYKAFLVNTTFYSLNRFYLIAVTCIAFILPLIQVSYLNQVFGKEALNQQHLLLAVQDQLPSKTWDVLLKQSLLYLYLMVTTIFTTRFVLGVLKLIRLRTTNKRHQLGNITFVNLNDHTPAFSFFNVIFLDPAMAEKETVIKHEMVHVEQRHSLDVLLLEMIQIISWFNPVAYLIKREMTVIHEYIADQLTTNEGIKKQDYAMLLIRNSMCLNEFKRPVQNLNQLTNQIFNKSILKRRINMLNKKQSTGGAKLRILFVLPVIGAMLCASTVAISKDYTLIDLYPKKLVFSAVADQDTTKKGKKVTTVNAKNRTGSKASVNTVNTTSLTDVIIAPPIVRKANRKRVAGSSPKEPIVTVVHFPPPSVEPIVTVVPVTKHTAPNQRVKTRASAPSKEPIVQYRLASPPPPPAEPAAPSIKVNILPPPPPVEPVKP
jgi:hypothetical protein